MTYRERRERRADRLREWSTKRESRRAQTLAQARTMAEAIPFGQPILVGHHSERRDRNYRERIRGKFDRAFEDDKKAREMSSRAATIDAQAEGAIYSDDGDAIERLTERIADLERQRERIKTVNRIVRGCKGDAEAFALAPLTADERGELLKLAQLTPYHKPLERGFPAYVLQNLGGNIGRQRARLAMLSGAGTKTPASSDASTATARAGLVITASMTTPSRPGKQPREVWNVTGNLAEWRPMLTRAGGNWYRGAFSFWSDPTEEIERACVEAEDDARARIVSEFVAEVSEPAGAPPSGTLGPCGPCDVAAQDAAGMLPVQNPLEDVAREIETREASAPPLAEAPFSLSAPMARTRGKEGRLW